MLSQHMAAQDQGELQKMQGQTFLTEYAHKMLGKLLQCYLGGS